MAFEADKPLSVEDVYQDKHVVGIEMINGVHHRVVRGTYNEQDTTDSNGMKIRLFVALLTQEEGSFFITGESRSVIAVIFAVP